MKLMKRLWILIIFLTTLPVSLIRADGGTAVQPYWTFPTDAPVTHIQTGDINGDGVPEVVMTTPDGWLYVVENDGRLAWRYELGTTANDLVVADIDGDKQAAEILVIGRNQNILLSNTQRPLWAHNFAESAISSSLASTADLDEDGRQEILLGNNYFVTAWNSKTGNPGDPEFKMGQPIREIWVGEVTGDSQAEIVPSPVGGNQVYVLDKNLKVVWQQSIEGQVGLVQGGDVNGDGRAEIAVLSASWDLFLLASDGKQLWHNQTMSRGSETNPPASGQMIVRDLNGDGHNEIIVLTPEPATVHTFKEDGNQLWQQPLGATGATARLAVADINGDGQTEVVVATEQQATLLDAKGRRLAEYHPATSGQHQSKITGALAYTDLNGDSQGEIIIGTETGLQVFGASAQIEQRELWRSPFLGGVTALTLADLNNDGQGEVLAGSETGQVYALTEDGHILWTVDVLTGEPFFETDTPQVSILALAAGDVDGDDQAEVVLFASPQICLLDSRGKRWVISAERKFITAMTVHDLDGDGRAEIILGGDSLLGGASVVRVLNGVGKQLWQWELTEGITAVDSSGAEILVGTDKGRVYRLTPAGVPAGKYELGVRVLTLGAGQAITENGRVYRLDEGGPTLAYDLGAPPRLARLSMGATAMLTGEGEVSLVVPEEPRWQEKLDNRVISLATGDVNGDGVPEVATGTERGRIHLFGLAVNQPPLLTKLAVAETRAGYAYGVDVNEPDGDPVTTTVEIWDPSVGIWVSGAAQSFSQGQGRLTLNVLDPFDTWDSGQESRFRFHYDDGHNQGVLRETVGPFSIPTLPWYLYYGQWAGLGALGLLVPALGWVIYRRQQIYHHSPVGQAESLLKQLRAHPAKILERLYATAQTKPVLLTHLPGLALEVGEPAIADTSEGFNLILTRSELATEGLRMVVRQGDEAELEYPHPSNGQSEIKNLYSLCLEALEANTVSRIVALQPRLKGIIPKDNEVASAWSALAKLGRVTEALHNYERVESVEDKVAYLAQVLETLGLLDREFQSSLLQPERNIFNRIALDWLTVTTNALQDLQGRAQIAVSLKTRQVLIPEQTTLALELTNTGRSPASNLTVALVPDQAYTLANGAVRLTLLPAGRSAVVELPVSVAASVEQFRAEFTISFDDRERSGKSLAFADVVRLLKPVTFRPLPNPYAPGTPLRPGSPIFFGRDDLFEFIAENMGGLARQNILVLTGQRRMGKTSFLQQLLACLGSNYLPVYLDGQSLGIDSGMANFFYDVALVITDALADHGLKVTQPELALFQDRPSGAFERTFLPAVFKVIGPRQLLLLFDEFEELEMRVASGKLESSIFPFFRHMMQHGGNLGFIFVGTHRLEELSTDYWSILFNIALYKHVTFLSEAAARALIVEPVAEHGLLYDDLALDKMLRVTAGHPYFLQLTCHGLINYANRKQRNYLTIQDVNSVLGEMVELGEAHFAFLWEQAGLVERLVLAALMQLTGQEPTVTAGQITELLTERGVKLDLLSVTEVLRRLVERDIVREIAGQPYRYDYKIELVRLWVERYKALNRVVEEVGRQQL